VPFASTVYQFAEAVLMRGSEEQKAAAAAAAGSGRADRHAGDC
jgi:hypothetical protein